MEIFIGSDHGGFELKQLLVGLLTGKGYRLTDCGSYSNDATDYPDFALTVANSVKVNPSFRGILICRSGEGMEIAANKVRGIRASLVWNTAVAQETRRDNDANILVLPADFIDQDTAQKIVTNFLETEFSGLERHIRRLEKISSIEKMQNES